MKAIKIDKYGDESVLDYTDVERPEPKDHRAEKLKAKTDKLRNPFSKNYDYSQFSPKVSQTPKFPTGVGNPSAHSTKDQLPKIKEMAGSFICGTRRTRVFRKDTIS